MEEPSIPPHWRLPLAALWISAALHLAIIGLVQIRPARLPTAPAPVLTAQLEARPAATAQAAVVPSPPDAPAAKATPPHAAAPAHRPVPPAPPTPAAAAPPPAAAPQSAPTAAELPNNPDAATGPGPSVAVPLLANPVYYSARELDVQPHALQPIQPLYPSAALDRQLSGTVTVELHLEADGRVIDAKVISADPAGYFEQAALAAFKGARFSPAIRHNEAVRCKILIKVKFDFNGQGAVSKLGP